MKIIKYLAIGSVLIASTSLTSCKKEGCTDSAAINYDESAKKDDESCSFQGEAVIWYDESTSQSLTLGGSSTLKYYVDEVLIGSTDASVYWTGAPDCGANGSINVTKDLGNAKSKTFTYKVIDNLGFTVESGILNISANNCENLQISN